MLRLDEVLCEKRTNAGEKLGNFNCDDDDVAIGNWKNFNTSNRDRDFNLLPQNLAERELRKIRISNCQVIVSVKNKEKKRKKKKKLNQNFQSCSAAFSNLQ
ncbi:origin recognition complex subunit 2 [Striga asiatica]|uniref:Origin recognition complex subunit 2 n=1 Tax=Striga asiatica TaxID=4170 RepID=A0A5A7R8L7_STRAF|nr:origin recognition complex subunit 2 [Striga asiatica]